MKKSFRNLTVGAVALIVGTGLLSAAPLPADSALFGVTFGSSQLLTINRATGVAAPLGSFGLNAFAYGVAAKNDRLYTFDQVDNRIHEINKVSGKFIRTIDIGVSGLQGEGDLAFRPVDGVGFLASALDANSNPVNDLYTFTITDSGNTGAAVRVGSPGVTIDALAFDQNNTLYCIGNGTLYTIDQTTGRATAVGSLGVDMNDPVAGMAFSPPSPTSGITPSQLYAAIDERLYTIDVTTGAATPVSTDPEQLSFRIGSSVSGIAFATGAGELGNMSGRLNVGTGENVGIGGFIVRGTPDKKVVIRGLGPSLSFPNRLANPLLQLYNGQGQLITQNDDFASSPDADAITALGLAPRDPKESAILRTLPAGNYTAVLSGVAGGTGVGLVEIYDVDPGSGSQAVNLSVRGFTSGGDNVLIGGSIIVGSAPQRIVVRAIGPDLGNRGVANPLPDPFLEIFDANGMSVKSNDNYMTDPDAAEIAMRQLAPNDPLESATIVQLPAGKFTAVVTGNGGSGVALIETFNVTDNTPVQ
ncbi:MAG: hypothetical protein ACR2NX_13125 [Chthoniobacterales bacterium]